MRKTLITFVLKLIAASAILFALWEWKGQDWYGLFYRAVAVPVFNLLGVELTSVQEAVNVVYDRFYNILPFLSLMIAAWGISWRRRLIGTAAGFATTVIWHIAFTLIVRAILMSHGLDETAYKLLSPWFLFSDALPFVLWVVIAHKPLTALLPARKASQPES